MQSGIDPATGAVAGDTFEAQARQALRNLGAVLEGAGSSLDRVVTVTYFVAEPSAFATLNAQYKDFFLTPPPLHPSPAS